MSQTSNTISIENARLVFRNFSGKEGRFNPRGKRNFGILLDSEPLVKKLEADGWNVRYLEPRDPDDNRQPYLPVQVNYNFYPPKIILIKTTNKIILNEDDVNILDWADIENVDLILRPYNWEVNGKTGIKAYLKTMYVTILEDEFESKYRNVPDSPSGPLDEDTPPWD